MHSLRGLSRVSSMIETVIFTAIIPPSQLPWDGITTHVFVEPVNGALPGQIGRGLVIPFWRRVAIEPMHGTRVDIALVWNVRRAQGLVVRWPRRRQSRVEFPVMHEDRRLNFGDVVCGGWTAIERRCRRQIGSQPYR